jgi:hypothetical protein
VTTIGHGDELIRRYLLGKCSEAEQEDVERQLLGDEVLSEQVAMVEEELVDDYILGLLSEEDRVSFRRLFSASQSRRSMVATTQALVHHANSSQVPLAESKAGWRQALYWRQSPGWIVAFSFSLIVLLSFGTWRLNNSREHGGQIGRAQVSQPKGITSKESLPSPDKNTPASSSGTGNSGNTTDNLQIPPKGASSVLSLVLVPGLSRGEVLPSVRLGAESKALALRLVTRSPLSAGLLMALLFDAGSSEIFSSEVRPSSDRSSVVFVVPVKKLASGEYHVVLQQKDSDGHFQTLERYYFRCG